MERLTGFALRNKVEELRSAGIEKSEILVTCGYGREGKVANYTEFYQELTKGYRYEEAMQVREAERNNYTNMRQKEVCDAMFYGTSYKKNNDTVEVDLSQWNDSLGIYKYKLTCYSFYGEKLIELYRGVPDSPVYLILHVPSKKSKTVKARINAILRRTLGYSLYQKRGEWFINIQLRVDIPYTEGMRLYYPEL
jgi:hypothetical protein